MAPPEHVRVAVSWLLSLALVIAGALGSVSLAGATPANLDKTVRPAPESPGSKVIADLITERTAIEPGGAFLVGLRQRIAPGWHTYWINPGDSGEPPTIAWTLPAGFEAGKILWPHPGRIRTGPAMGFGYEDEVVLLTRIQPPRDLPAGQPVTLKAQVNWIVCEKICIPEEAALVLTLPVATGPAAPDPQGAAAIGRARQALPVESPWPASFSATQDAVVLEVGAPGLTADRVEDIWFYPARWGAIENAAPQNLRIGRNGISLSMTRGPLASAVEAPIDGVLVVKERLERGSASHAFFIQAVPGPGLAGAAGVSLLQAIGLALAGGLILNLMPCVLPVLSVKALALVQHSGLSRTGAMAHGLAYTAGVLVSFGALAGALVALRAGGEQVGWGFQLQSPLFVTLLAYVLLILALSLSGVVTIGGGMVGLGHRLTTGAGLVGSFFTGALATVAATPCTAPFMGVAVGFAVTQSAVPALLVFEALGLGLALPFLFLSAVPAWRRFLPRPGPWMKRLAQLLAIPLYASVAWLVWVLSLQVGPRSVAAAVGGLVLIGFSAWLYQVSRTARGSRRPMAVGAALVLVALAVGLGHVLAQDAGARAATAPSAEGPLASEPFSPARLAELRQRGTPVFVNVTAAWCISCLVNERVALRSPAVAEAFARKGVVYLKADWTNRDTEIARMLESFGRSGVPLYLFYEAGQTAAAPVVLPQILTEGIVIEALETVRAARPSQEPNKADPNRKET